jgi:hypothetical protein
MKPIIRLFVLVLAVCLLSGCSPPASHAGTAPAIKRNCALPLDVCPCEGGRGLSNARKLARAAAVTVKALGTVARVTAQAIDQVRDPRPAR